MDRSEQYLKLEQTLNNYIGYVLTEWKVLNRRIIREVNKIINSYNKEDLNKPLSVSERKKYKVKYVRELMMLDIEELIENMNKMLINYMENMITKATQEAYEEVKEKHLEVRFDEGLVENLIAGLGWQFGDFRKLFVKIGGNLLTNLFNCASRSIILKLDKDVVKTQVEKVVSSSFKQVERVFKTEFNYASNMATLEFYKQVDEKGKYKLNAVLDDRTSQICLEMDGKTFKFNEALVGINFPPLHPNCRTTIDII